MERAKAEQSKWDAEVKASMKKLTLAGVIAIALCGCTATRFRHDPKTGESVFERISFLQRVQVPALDIGTNGTVRLRGYNNDGGAEAAAKIAEGAAKGAVQGMK